MLTPDKHMLGWAIFIVVWVALMLLLAGCSVNRESDLVKVSSTLACATQIRCHIYQWQVGTRHIALELGGTHINCRCDPRSTAREGT